ncbi:unnamed protein product [Malus baccata var. baccata]
MANNISESLKGKKRPREADIDAQPAISIRFQEENLTFSSTLVGLRMMRAQFPNNERVTVQLFILRSQLYSIVDNRTQVDRDFRGLREKVLRAFKLNTGQDDHAIIFLDNYLCQMEKVVKRFEEKDEDILECKLLSRGGKVKDEHISLLINSGFLKTGLRFSPLMRFHLCDLIGSGHLKTAKRLTGLVVQVSKD